MSILGLIQSKIQHGTTSATDVTIEAVSDMDKCLVFVDGNAVGYLTTTTNLHIVYLATYGQTTVNYQVIELGGATV